MMRHLQVLMTVLGLGLCLAALAQQPGGQMTPEQRFKQLDRDGDGKLSPQELPGEWFGRLDTNQDGVVTLEEAKAGAGSAPGVPPTPAPAVASLPPRSIATDGRPYLVLICIDACRPDYLEFSDIPNIRKLMAEGVTYEQAWVGHLRNDTPPGHAVIATGTFPRTNRIIGFHWRDPKTGKVFKPTSLQSVQAGSVNQVMAASGCGSLGSVYKQAYPDTRVVALSSDKSYAAAALGADAADAIVYCRYDPKRGYGTEPGLTLEPLGVTGRLAAPEIMASPALQRKLVNPWDGDTWTVDLALQIFARDKPEILLINLPQTDNSGHKVGATLDRAAMSAVIANADRQVGRIMEAYRQAGLYDRTLFILTGDHGMAPNLQTIDEGPMAAIVSKYGMERTAARLEFYVQDPSRSGEAAEEIARLRMPGIHRVYYKTRDAQGACTYLPAASSGGQADPELDACYAYLTSTYASAESADVVLFSAEDWNVKLSSEYFKGDHGTVTWDTQHVPLVLAGPGLRRGGRSQAPARLVDIAPTALTAMGLEPARMEGIALADALASPSEDLTRQQQVVSDRLTPLRDALRRRHDQDLGSQAQPAAQAPAAQAPAAQAPAAQAPAAQAPTAQPPAAPAAGGTATERFRQFDRNSDGRVTKGEAGNAPWFDRLDRNRDGAITPDELGQPAPAATQRPATGVIAPTAVPSPTTMKPPSTPSLTGGPPPQQLKGFTFTRDYTPGSVDSRGKMRTGQELMRIVTYRGQLFASTSTFTDPRAYSGDSNYTGCQVLRKSDSQSGWEVDASFGRRYLRTDCLEVVRFTQDANGRPLPQPVEMLVAGIWDVGETVRATAETAARDAVGRGVARDVFGRELGEGGARTVTAGNRSITVAIRDDTSGQWIISKVAAVPDGERGFSSVRAMRVHRDQVTGQECLFVGAACGGMYRGTYDPSVPGRIRWPAGDELTASLGRVHSMCVCNGSLYASTDYGGLTVQNQKGGIFRRIDGPQATWERVYFNYDPQYSTWNQTDRGITTVPAEDGSGKEVILVGVEWPPEPIIVRIEPHHEHRAVIELNYNDYFTKVFGRPPQILGGSKQHPHAGCQCAALNYFEPFADPVTGETDHFVTLFLIHPDDPAAGANGAYFLIRRAPGVYEWGEIPSGLPAGQHLRGTRTVQRSPFPDEPNTYYFGGCFNGPDEQPPKPNMAWIYKGVWQATQ